MKKTDILMKDYKEVVFEDLMQIIHNDSKGKAFELLDTYGALKHIIPYIDELKTIGKCKYHKVNAFTHMNTTYGVFKKVQAGDIELKGMNIDELLKKNIDNFEIWDYLAFAAFVHDIGKYTCFKKQGEKISFLGHDKAGAEIVQEVCRSHCFPDEAVNIIEKVVEAHMYPLELFKNPMKEYKKNFYKFFSKYKGYVSYILLISFCDVYATRLYEDAENEKEKYKYFIEKIFYEYSIYREIRYNKLLSRNEILDIIGNKQNGIIELLEHIDELRYLNRIKTKEEAIQYIKNEK